MPDGQSSFHPTPVYYEATARGDLAWRIAQRVKDVQREHGPLETKEVRNVVQAVLADEMEFEDDGTRFRLVTPWTYRPVEGRDA